MVCFRKLDLSVFFKAGFEYLDQNKMATELYNAIFQSVCACVMWERSGWCCVFVYIQVGCPPLQPQILICVFACMRMCKGESWC